jgi:hypothetical protein
VPSALHVLQFTAVQGEQVNYPPGEKFPTVHSVHAPLLNPKFKGQVVHNDPSELHIAQFEAVQAMH